MMSLCMEGHRLIALSPVIQDELILLAMSFYSGLVLILCYDSIRIFRKVFHASLLREIIEDTIFWTVAAICIFNMLLKYNYGRPRYFSIGAVLGAMALYEWFIGRKIIDKIALLLKKILLILLKPLKKTVKIVKLTNISLKNKFKKGLGKCHKKDKELQED